MKKKNAISKNTDLGSSPSEGIFWNDGEVTIIERPQHIETGYRMMKADVYVISLCRKGNGAFYINNRLEKISENHLLVCPPDVILENGRFSEDFDCCGFIFTSEYIRSLHIVFEANWDVRKLIERMPVLPLTETEATTFMQYYGLLRNKFTELPHKYRNEVIGGILQAFTCEFFRIQERLMPQVPQSQPAGTAECLFQRFLRVLSNSFPKSRKVTFYADRLCVCPKYLSAVCKKQCGLTASGLITQFVLKDIEFLLKQREKSIKEIVVELDFPNISFFGTYVRNHLGISPRQYRSRTPNPAAQAEAPEENG